MAKKTFDLTPDSVEETKIVEELKNDVPVPPSSTPFDSSITEKKEEEDLNKIKVTISDRSPIVVLFGAGSSGKTMTLVRLTRWLQKHGFRVEPDRTFQEDKHYEELCNNFGSVINSDFVAQRTRHLDFMLIKVMNKYGEPICQILEAQGEHYFNPDNPNAEFPRYIKGLKELDNPKTWIFIVEKDWKNLSDRLNYASKIIKMQQQNVQSKDRVIFTCHKADLHSALFNNGIPNKTQFFKEIKNQYEGIFSKYMNKNPITKLWRTYNFDFVVFSAGTFNKTADNKETYDAGSDKYPAKLWKSIVKTVRGGW